jgi:hypothetical protein
VASLRKFKKSIKKTISRTAYPAFAREIVGPKRKRSAAKRRKPVQNPTVYDAAGKKFGKFARKSAPIVARAIGGTVGKPKRSKNPLPVGRYVTVRAKRLPNGKVQLYGAPRKRR